jgi:hypothetical protein
LDIALERGDPYNQAATLIGLSMAHWRLGRLDEAAGHATQAMTISRERSFRMLEGQAMTTLAGVYDSRADPGHALDLAERSLAIHAETGHRLGKARALVIIGNTMTSDSVAQHYWDQAWEILRGVHVREAERVRRSARTHRV